ncbi:hypothetical protein QR680_014343 [Steinernema hermaphroditum]|uniref:Tyrosine specific protein phosphatases domain-containing protein n=1 Tax=Steinernema hermaphroditum TaxID=289476 RepID=A0AA39M316_9BILA|nr:hypothetical protein QR680_014343 [Steinernema hermaphroditum]
MPRTSAKIPDKWSKYEPIGTVIPETRFICFKTPLSDHLAWSKVHKSQRFNVSDLFRKVAEMNQELGLIIDLTNSDRYYDPNDVEGMMVEYEKLYCPSGGFCERDDLVETFNNLVENFVTRNLENKLLIGVHCSDGVNRCGYLVCNFLIHKLGWNSHEALNAFEQARGHAIDRGHYVAAVHRATRERKPKKRQRMEELQGMDEDGDAHCDKGEKKKKKKRKKNKESDDEGMEDTIHTLPSAETSLVSSFFAMEEQMKKTVATASPHPEATTPVPGQAQHISANSSPAFAGEEEDIEDEEGDDGSEGAGTPGQNESISQKRRRRRQRKQQMYETMKRGNFWEINEMLKDQAP